MDKTYNLLFLCHDNAGRSLMAEAMVNKMAQGRFNAYSAGSQPSPTPHPVALEILKHEGFDTTELSPKSMDLFHSENAPVMDLVISLCQNSKEDAEFINWEGEPLTAHWHFEDPHEDAVKEKQTHDSEYHHYEMVQRSLSNRIRLLLSFPDGQLDKIKLHH